MKKIMTISIIICVTIMFIAGLPLNGDAEVIHGCYSKSTGALRILSSLQERVLPHCTNAEIPISWNSVSGIDRVIRGEVNDNGTIAAGTGFTVSTASGGGIIKFDTPFPTKPTCVITPLYVTCTNGICVDIIDTIFFCDLFMTNAQLTYECFGYHPTQGSYCCDHDVPPITFICAE